MQDVYHSQGVNKCSTHAPQARGQQTPQKSTHRGQPSPTQKPLSLDKLAASGTKPEKDILLSRAKYKDFSYCLALSLSNIQGSPLHKSYRNTAFCASILMLEGKKETSHYCGNRWCVVCNRIRTAKLINSYVPQILLMKNPYFVTLTIPNVEGKDLRAALVKMNSCVSKIVGKHKKRHQRGQQVWKVNGIKKLECTYSKRFDNFHPHFHFIIDGKEAANTLVSDWLKIYPGTDKKGQDCTKAFKGSENELFKYFTKIVTRLENNTFGVYVKSLDTIFCAMKGLQVVSNLGDIKPVNEEIEEIQAQDLDDSYLFSVSKYFPEHRDWIDIETGEPRTGYKRPGTLNEIINNFV